MTRPRRSALAAAVLAVALLAVGAVPATAVPAVEDFSSFSSISAGQLLSTPFVVGGCGSASLGTSDLSGPDFAPAGSATQPTDSCTTATSIGVALDTAVDGLDLYLVGLPYGGACTDGSYTLTTDGPGTASITSGLSSATLVGSTLTLPLGSPNSGVVHLDGPVSTVTVSSAHGAFTMTFALGTAQVAPATTTTTSVATPTTADAPGSDVAGSDVAASGPVAPAFTC
jgi:hypothetical protein